MLESINIELKKHHWLSRLPLHVVSQPLVRAFQIKNQPNLPKLIFLKLTKLETSNSSQTRHRPNERRPDPNLAAEVRGQKTCLNMYIHTNGVLLVISHRVKIGTSCLLLMITHEMCGFVF